MDNLFEQVANISKAHGYDVLAKYVEELKAEKEQMKRALLAVQEDAKFDGFITQQTSKQVSEVLKNLKP